MMRYEIRCNDRAGAAGNIILHDFDKAEHAFRQVCRIPTLTDAVLREINGDHDQIVKSWISPKLLKAAGVTS